MNLKKTDRFKEFFEQRRYVYLKNHLYNYLLRKLSVERNLKNENITFALEVGTGISPTMTRTDNIVYTELYPKALEILKPIRKSGWYVAADAMYLPFKADVFSHVICSEVLEHIENDRKALKELSRVILPKGQFILTFPHRKRLYTIDDRYVHHFRRYNIADIVEKLINAGLKPCGIEKVLGPLEKITMGTTIFFLSKRYPIKRKEKKDRKISEKTLRFILFTFKWINRVFAGLLWIEARIVPRSICAVLLIRAQKC